MEGTEGLNIGHYVAYKLVRGFFACKISYR